jgi:D-alanyl-D-alanine carboxypeptidase
MRVSAQASRALLALLSVLAACSSQGPSRYAGHLYLRPGRYYPPPGPPSDPWGPYIHEAAQHFSEPESWIREVMRQESAGEEQALSPAGAIGLMQVMPGTYAELMVRYNLGPDPWEPHDNIMAGAAYIREMYNQFGSPGFLAAYNAGPQRMNDYLTAGDPLPTETVNYVAAIAPRLGSPSMPVSRQAVYASTPHMMREPTPAGCDLDTAYDPSEPCKPVVVAAAAEPPPPQYPAPMAAPRPPPGPVDAPIIITPPSVIAGAWAVQVGAFSTPAAARSAALSAERAVPNLLERASIAITKTEPFGPTVLFRARLTNLSATTAAAACTQLTAEQMPCLLVRPSSF